MMMMLLLLLLFIVFASCKPFVLVYATVVKENGTRRCELNIDGWLLLLSLFQFFFFSGSMSVSISVCVCVCASYAAMQQQRSRFFSVYVWNLFILSVCIHSHLILDSCLYFSTTVLMLMLKHFCWLFVPFEKFHSLIEMFKCIFFSSFAVKTIRTVSYEFDGSCVWFVFPRWIIRFAG